MLHMKMFDFFSIFHFSSLFKKYLEELLIHFLKPVRVIPTWQGRKKSVFLEKKFVKVKQDI